jgi:hypothetical protein
MQIFGQATFKKASESMSVSQSPKGDRSPDLGSPYHDAATSNDYYRTPSPPLAAPQDDSSHDETLPHTNRSDLVLFGPRHLSV